MSTTYEIITEQVLKAMNTDKVIPWHKPWKVLALMNAISKKSYRGVNVLLLSLFGNDNLFLTPNQVKAKGGYINKGSKTNIVTFFNFMKREDENTGKEKKIPFLKYYRVISLKDTNLESIGKYKREELPGNELGVHELAESLVAQCGVKIEYGGNRASSSIAGIHMPNKAQFHDLERFYGTLFHEIGHSLGHELDRQDNPANFFGSPDYSKEELIAEMFANYALSYCGLDSSKAFDNSIAYLQNWIQVLGNNPKWLVSAAGKAQKRFDLLLEKAGLKAKSESDIDGD